MVALRTDCCFLLHAPPMKACRPRVKRGFVRNPAPSQLLVAAGTTHESMLPQQRMVAERRWRLAMQSRGHPSHVMAEVYRCLESNSVHWKKLGPYNLKCRKSIGLTGEGAGLAQVPWSSGQSKRLEGQQRAVGLEVALHG